MASSHPLIMDSFQSQHRKYEMKCSKKRLTQDQIRLLETSFSFSNKLDPDRKSRLAQELGLPPRQVAIWYQNKRARWKNQSLEYDYKALQLRLESVLADNARLEKEVGKLKDELHRAQEMFLSLSTTTPPSYSSLPNSLSSSCCEDVGSSSLLGDSSKELYACLIGDDDHFVGKSDGINFFSPSV